MESKSLKSNLNKKLSQNRGIALVILATLFTAAGLTLLKIGVGKYSSSVFSLLNAAFIGGVLLYALSATLLIMGLKQGSLSTLYPFVSLSYIWIILISVFIFKETLTPAKTIGSCAIILGVSILGMKGDSQKKAAEKDKGKKRQR